MPTKRSQDPASSCAFAYSDGRQCRMLRSSSKSKYCLHHERKLRFIKEAEAAALDLSDPISGGFVTATALSQSVSRLFAAVAQGRLDPKSANALARVAEILLKTISSSTAEFRNSFKGSYWAQIVRESCGELPKYVPPVIPTRNLAGSKTKSSQPPKPPNPPRPDTIDEFIRKFGIAAN